jgi:Zn-finger nucleic acid-binding protein
MESVMVGQVEPVPLERCRRGHGLWLDGGELESVLAYFDPARHSRIIGLMREIFPHTRPKTEGLL